VDLLEDIARFTWSRKAGEPRATCADPPGRNGDAEGHDLLHQGLRVDPVPRQCALQGVVVLGDRVLEPRVMVGDEIRGDRERRAHRVKAWALPASTLRMLPVDLAERSDAKK